MKDMCNQLALSWKAGLEHSDRDSPNEIYLFETKTELNLKIISNSQRTITSQTYTIVQFQFLHAELTDRIVVAILQPLQIGLNYTLQIKITVRYIKLIEINLLWCGL